MAIRNKIKAPAPDPFSSPVSIEHGGTGASTVSGARNALGLGNTSGALPIANGGTGTTTVDAARTALGLGVAATKNIGNTVTFSFSNGVLNITTSTNGNASVTGVS